MKKYIDNNLDLYRPDKINYLKSLEYAKNMKITDEKLIFHLLWRVPRDFGRKQLAVLKSIIVNHQENDLEINLWSNVDLSNNPWFKQVSKYVSLRRWDMYSETTGTILENYFQKSSIFDEMCYLEGDLFRLLILYKYGGFYIDMDVLVLRNMSTLNQMEFLYQWGTSGFSSGEPEMTMNGAIMRMNKNSSLSLEFLEKIKSAPAIRNTTSWGNKLYSQINTNDLLVLPGVWFNSEWGFEDTSNEPFKNTGKVELFEGAYAWHWHNKWDDAVEIGSKFQVIEEMQDKKFKLING